MEAEASSSGSAHGHHQNNDQGSDKLEPLSKESNNNQDEFSNNQAHGNEKCDIDGQSHGDVALEEEQDIL